MVAPLAREDADLAVCGLDVRLARRADPELVGGRVVATADGGVFAASRDKIVYPGPIGWSSRRAPGTLQLDDLRAVSRDSLVFRDEASLWRFSPTAIEHVWSSAWPLELVAASSDRVWFTEDGDLFVTDGTDGVRVGGRWGGVDTRYAICPGGRALVLEDNQTELARVGRIAGPSLPLAGGVCLEDRILGVRSGRLVELGPEGWVSRGPTAVPFARVNLTGTGPDDVWASEDGETLHWDGRRWTRFDTSGFSDWVSPAPGELWILRSDGALEHRTAP